MDSRIKKIWDDPVPLDHLPFTIYECMTPQGYGERDLRNRGMKIVNRNYCGYRLLHPNVREYTESFVQNGEWQTRHYFETPVGTLSTLTSQGNGTSWQHEAMFKTPDDYAAMRYYLADEVVIADYDSVIQAKKNFGTDIILRGNLPLEPLQSLISGNLIRLEDFCIEWMDNRDEILGLYQTIQANHRKIYPIAAKSPHSHFNYGGNLIVDIINSEMYEKYYMPHYFEAAEILHRDGKLIGSHYDGKCKALAELIGKSALDYIEAFTPAPDTDLSLLQAYELWADKLIWLNFPSSMHLKSSGDIRDFGLKMLDTLPDYERLIVGITEDMPPESWQASCGAIMDVLEKFNYK